MRNQLTSLQVKNFRSLADITVQTNTLNVLFGPNGSGKSTFLDALWFIRDCAIRGVDLAASDRDHGIGILWDGAEESENVLISMTAGFAQYEVNFGYSSGRIEPFVGEKLSLKNSDLPWIIDRKIGSDKMSYFLHQGNVKHLQLKEPEKLALTKYVEYEDSESGASEIDYVLRNLRHYDSRAISFFKLKRFGSESDYGDRLQDRCENLWSVLRNLHDRRVVDERYDTIISFMRESFPGFDTLFLEQTSRYTVYGNFLDKRRRKPIRASGVSDGHLQMLINLTALFSEGANRSSLILFDEPETSLHPWALAVFSKAVKLATQKWNKQVFIATHSPVLISQFDPDDILATELDESGKTVMRRVSQITEIQDLLEEYATGSLYMAEIIAPQSKDTSAVQVG